MARGWESKSIESQQEQANERTNSVGKRMTQNEKIRQRELESLHLSLKDILRRVASNSTPRHREMLERARTDIEGKIEKWKANS